MLPFLKKNQAAATGVIVKTRQPDEKPDMDDQDDPKAAKKAAAMDLLRAIEAKDHAGIADALQAAFEIMDAEPHEEGDHVEPHSYDAQNMKAGE